MDETGRVTRAGEHHADVHREASDVNVRAILWFAGGFVIVAVIVHVALYFLFDVFAARERGRTVAPLSLISTGRREIPPEPRLQPFPDEPPRWDKAQQQSSFKTPVDDMRELHAREEAILTGYGWVDRSKGVVRIPIDRAMEIVVQRGLPVRQPMPQPERGTP